MFFEEAPFQSHMKTQSQYPRVLMGITQLVK